MSILFSLRKWIDGNQHRIELEEQRRKRDALPPDLDPDLIDAPPPKEKEAVMLRCRICGHEDAHKFCSVCLAETMV